MMKDISFTLLKSLAITVAAVLIAVGINAVRKDGIPLVAEVPYEIFSTCMDAEAAAETVSAQELSGRNEQHLIVDARPARQFEIEHAKNAVNIPFSALFGASEEDVERVRKTAADRLVSAIIVYGAYEDPDNPGVTVDFGKPLADQLTESGLQNVRYVNGGLAEMKKQGTPTVKGR